MAGGSPSLGIRRQRPFSLEGRGAKRQTDTRSFRLAGAFLRRIYVGAFILESVLSSRERSDPQHGSMRCRRVSGIGEWEWHRESYQRSSTLPAPNVRSDSHTGHPSATDAERRLSARTNAYFRPDIDSPFRFHRYWWDVHPWATNKSTQTLDDCRFSFESTGALALDNECSGFAVVPAH
jgi:hypothetical protein